MAEDKKIADERLVAEARRRAEENRLAALKAESETPEAQRHVEPPKPVAANPFSKGTGRVNINYRVGDRYRYRVIDPFTKLETRTFNDRVSEVSDAEVIYNDGRFAKDLLGNNIRRPNGTEITDQQFYVAEYSLGKKWTTRYQFVTAAGQRNKVEIEFKVVALESITVPAGTFDAWKIEGHGFNTTRGSNLHYTYWIAPDRVRRYIIQIIEERNRMNNRTNNERIELVEYRQQA